MISLWAPVYNSLDASSTSIAIRLNIEDASIQIVDNGCGVSLSDFNLLGQRYATSKCVDLDTLKSAPNNYGYRGQALASLIDVSQKVNIISRHKDHDKTWKKTFKNGKKVNITELSARPSKGTTVEIKGFLYNLKIQKTSINPIYELNSIISFLEQISLVHFNISFSVRDDSTNEIVYQLHKSRDIYQSLKSLFGITMPQLEELQVEKKEYKIKAFIAKRDNHLSNHHWIYLNGKIVINTDMHKIVNDNLKKFISIKPKRNSNHKSKKSYDEEVCMVNKLIPSYFLFITCPYLDYDILDKEKETVLKFKEYNSIKTLIEKVIRFYVGETKLESNSNKKHEISKEKEDTRFQVKQLMEKILKNGSNKLQMQNGVKGRVIKRKNKNTPKNNMLKQNKCLKVIHNDGTHHHLEPNKSTVNNYETTKGNDKDDQQIVIERGPNKTQLQQVPKNVPFKKHKLKNKKCHKNYKKDQKNVKRSITSKVLKNNRHEIISKKVNDFLQQRKNLIPGVYEKEKVEYSTVKTGNKTISVRKNYHEIIIHEKIQSNLKCEKNYAKKNFNKREEYKKTADLLKLILISQQETNSKLSKTCAVQPEPGTNFKNINSLKPSLLKLTYDSHANYQYRNESILNPNQQGERNKLNANYHFITKQSADNFRAPISIRKPNKYQQCKPVQPFAGKKNLLAMYHNSDYQIEHSYTIEFSESCENNNYYRQTFESNVFTTESNDINVKYTMQFTRDGLTNDIKDTQCFGSTYSVFSPSVLTQNIYNSYQDSEDNIAKTYTISSYDSNEQHIEFLRDENINGQINWKRNDVNYLFISKSQQKEVEIISQNKIVDPREVCETVISEDVLGSDIQKEFNNTNIHTLNTDLPENNDNININKENKVSHHFFSFTNTENNVVKNIHVTNRDEILNTLSESPILPITKKENITNVNNFFLKDRKRFIPKGMSQIYKYPSGTKLDNHNFNIDDNDYYNTDLYDNFANNVKKQFKIFETGVRNCKEFVSKNIVKVTDKLDKDNASLMFNGESLKYALVLGQIDEKFIAAKIKGMSHGTKNPLEFIVLFDQHAVHERIRLEANMKDYLLEDQWHSVPVDNVELKLSKEEIVYLHNHGNKFSQFGLHWDILNNCYVSITCIPHAVLGKNPRPVEKVMAAVKRLISEQIEAITVQSGCVSLYPRSIMDLVFSEACRYAIKFGDSLTKNECVDLLNQLSECKTPFQCAHGRPVMAVMFHIVNETRDFKVTQEKLRRFRDLQK